MLGGDRNATLDRSRVDKNLDVLNMVSLPSLDRSNAIHDIATTLNLTDPYRTFYPSRKDYTYIPSAVGQNNRSRLDFFLVSTTLMPHCSNCTISDTLLSTDFDHKQITLNFTRSKCTPSTIVKDFPLEGTDTETYIKASLIESYTQHGKINQVLTVALKESYLSKIAEVLRCLATIREIELESAKTVLTHLNEMTIAANRTEINLKLGELPDLNFFESLELECNSCTFFEVAVMAIKNGAMLHQAHYYKVKKAKVANLIENLKTLKKDYRSNEALIFEKERELAQLIELELRAELKHMRLFEKINSEKITPHFMALAKKSGSNDCLTDITDDNGANFGNEGEQEKFITDLYKNLYKKRENENRVMGNCI